MDTATQLNADEVQNLIEKSILSGRQLRIQYTNSKGITDHYLILSITSTWTNSFNTVAESLSKGRSSPFNKFRYDRISAVDITDEIYEPSDLLIEKLKDGSLFSEVDNRLARRGGLKGYASSVSYVTSSRERLTKDEARNLLRQIDISPLEGWERGIVVDITDGDTFDLLLESAPCGSYVTRLFGVDTPECNHNSEEEIFGLEAKVAIEDMFKTSRCCYVKREGTDAYRRPLMHVLNADKKNVAIELLENGLGFPMMGYFTERSLRDTYVNATCKAYEDHKGLWAIDEIRSRYNNVISDTSIIEIDILAISLRRHRLLIGTSNRARRQGLYTRHYKERGVTRRTKRSPKTYLRESHKVLIGKSMILTLLKNFASRT